MGGLRSAGGDGVRWVEVADVVVGRVISDLVCCDDVARGWGWGYGIGGGGVGDDD